jgi:hypothetical protein
LETVVIDTPALRLMSARVVLIVNVSSLKFRTLAPQARDIRGTTVAGAISNELSHVFEVTAKRSIDA